MLMFQDYLLNNQIVEKFILNRLNQLAIYLYIPGAHNRPPNNINKIIPFFKNHPIGTIKEKDFRDFTLAAELITNKDHLTLEGLAKIKKKSN